ncbi:DUF723 domain-containing protein [Inhella proteolytica]|uniref:DUF723 domain-containing protein n=1 Tax=Inhella proteolytica TaxID=2795029 RepID=A0A931J227_9BURK|nr:DUF723 domain-containing protein [Inhella proteolytica]MBH9576730.1 DUF723 domain-containing protein [Inhella proteolytica]
MATQPARRSNEEFAAAAHKVHGDAYDYSRVDYRSNRTNVTIVCKQHGAFEQTPSNHLRGRGCAKCASAAQALKLRKSDAAFIEQAQAIHGSKYDYSHVEYAGALKKVLIVCRLHGPYFQRPDSHLHGQGCPKCRDTLASERMRWTTERFCREARTRFGERFTYAGVEYTDAWTPVAIDCPVHGEFKQAPVTHLLSKYGCPKCAVEATHAKARLPTEDFLLRAHAVHGNRYGYGGISVVDSKHKVTITCHVHGEFRQSPSDHLAGKGCPKCGNDSARNRQRQTVERFVDRARQVHGEKYDYSLIDYSTAKKPVRIVCPVHGVFEQTPDMHLKSGCRRCADDALPGAYTERRFSSDGALESSVGTLYYVKLSSESEQFFKVGISKNSASKRFAGYGTGYGYRIEVLKARQIALGKAYEIEQRVLSEFGALHRYTPRNLSKSGRRFGGRTECFDTPLPESLMQLFED